MVKSIKLKLLKIKYNGDSIGDDIRAEIEILGKFSRIELCDILMRARRGDGESVGILEVID